MSFGASSRVRGEVDLHGRLVVPRQGGEVLEAIAGAVELDWDAVVFPGLL
jgi:hypothetical protein